MGQARGLRRPLRPLLAIRYIVPMDLGLSGKVALVAAASQGLGRASAHALAQEGARVAILSRRQEELDKVAAEIGAALAVKCDLSQAGDIASAVEKVKVELGPVSILVTNCGGPPAGIFDTITEEQWDHAYQQVFMSVLRLTRAVLPGMREARWGRIINILSSSAEQPIPGLIVSNAFRPALAGWAKTLSAEIAKDNVLVTSVLPGRIETARTEEIDRATAQRTGRTVEEVHQQKIAPVPLKRYGRVEEFGAAIAFLASERASYFTGSLVRVDGGMVASI